MNIEFALVPEKEKAAKAAALQRAYTDVHGAYGRSLLRLAGDVSDDGERDVASNVSTTPGTREAADLLGGVLVFVDSVAHVVRFPVELALILLGEVAIVGGHVFLFIVLQALLTTFQTGGLSGLQLPVLHTVGDAVLLIGFTPIHLVDARMAGIDLSRAGSGSVAGLRLSSGRSDDHQTTHCQD